MVRTTEHQGTWTLGLLSLGPTHKVGQGQRSKVSNKTILSNKGFQEAGRHFSELPHVTQTVLMRGKETDQFELKKTKQLENSIRS